MELQKRIILVKSPVKIVRLFIDCIEKAFRADQAEVLLFDMNEWDASTTALLDFCRKPVDFMYTMNNALLNLKINDSVSFWDNYEIFVFNHLLDHPRYYIKELSFCPQNYQILCIDQGHVRFIKTFLGMSQVAFLPHGGIPQAALPPYKERSMPVLFTGSGADLTKLKAKMDDEFHVNEPVFLLYQELLSAMLKNPNLLMEDILFELTGGSQMSLSLAEFADLNLYFSSIEIYLRNYYRHHIVKKLLENGLTVHILGQNWEGFGAGKKGTLVSHGHATPLQCLEQTAHAKTALNVMPWFKEGFHERIPNAMLAGTLVITDISTYTLEHFKHRSNLLHYQLTDLETLPGMIAEYLDHSAMAEAVAQKGQDCAQDHHSWKKRTEVILKLYQEKRGG